MLLALLLRALLLDPGLGAPRPFIVRRQRRPGLCGLPEVQFLLPLALLDLKLVDGLLLARIRRR